jgi:hypothetical protein
LADDYVVIQSPYHEKFIAELKEGIPPEDRMWVPEEKVWEVSGDLYEEVMDITSRHFNVKVEIVNA